MKRFQGEQNEKLLNETAENRKSSGCVGGNNPCGSAKCVASSIEPEDFLSECIAPVCWDCWFVSQKIQL